MLDKKKAKAIEKAKAAKLRAIEKQRAKLSCPVYQKSQRDKQIKQAEKQRAKQLAKAKLGPTPEQIAKKKAAQLRMQEKARSKSNQKPLKRSKLKPSSPKGKSRNNNEHTFHDTIAAIGCICCVNKGLTAFTNEQEGLQYVSIHHVYGRTGQYCHYYCLPLCQWHHNMALPKEIRKKFPSVFPVHAGGAVGGKTAWEAENGTQDELIAQVWQMVGFKLDVVA